jgi:tyrosyl-tRNA synthetase
MKKKTSHLELKERGLVTHEGGGTLDEILADRRKVYLGVDPTADSLHVGNLVPIILVKHLYNLGHEPFLLVGGATGMIGDPRESGERSMLEAATLKKNTLAIKKQLSVILGKKGLRVFDNSQWLGKLSLITFLREVGKNFTVNQLIKRDIIKRRLETEEDSISYTEFSYSLLQAYDFLHLFKAHGVNLQVGGSDQWANIISGVDLIRRKTGQAAFALTTPIVVDKATGKKFGKSEGNAVWLDPRKTSPFAFYQFWLNVSDENVGDYLKIFSFLPLAEIEEILSKQKEAPQSRLAQKAIAREVTAFVHGKQTTKAIEKVTDILFGSGAITKISPDVKKLLLKEVPSAKLTKKQIKDGISIIDALVTLDLAKSKTEARTLIQGKGVKVNGTTIESIDYLLTIADVQDGLIFLRRAKKFALVTI